MKRAIEQFLLNAVSYHPAALGEIGLGVFIILYACLAKRISFQGDFPSWNPEDEFPSYKPTRNIRLYGISLGMISVLFGLYGVFFAEP